MAEEGFTLLEFLVSMSLLVVGLLPAAKLMSSAIVLSGNSRARIVATYLASQTIEAVRSSAANSSSFWNPPPLGQSISTSVVNTITYTVTKDVEWVGQGQSGSNCSSGGSSPNILQVSAYVTWPTMLGARSVQSTTDLAPPVGAFSTNTGAIASQVSDSNGSPAANATVSINGPSTSSIVTGADGCAFFAFVTPGTYTVSALEAGFVSDQELANPSYASVVVAVSQTVSRSFLLDQSSTITASVTASPAPAGGLPLSVDSNKLSLYGFASFPAGTTSLTPLFPYNGGYVPFAGSCSDADPLGKDTSGKAFFYPTASGAAVPVSAVTPVDIGPGMTAATTVQLYPLTLKVQVSVLGVLVLPVGVRLTVIPTVAGNAQLSPVWSSSINWVCPTPVATYSPALTVIGGLSTTGIGLGHYTIVQASRPTSPLAYVWVEPDGTHLVSTTTGAVAVGASTVTVTVPLLP